LISKDCSRFLGIDYSKRIDFERLFPIFGTCRPDRKREYYFLEGMTFPAETVIIRPKVLKNTVVGEVTMSTFTRSSKNNQLSNLMEAMELK